MSQQILSPKEANGIQIHWETIENVLRGKTKWLTPANGIVTAGINKNLAALLEQTRECALCGIIATDMALEPFTTDEGESGFHWLPYAQSKKLPTDTVYLIRMTRGHVIERNKGGSDHFSNLQLQCIFCNYLQTEVANQNYDAIIVLGHRIYQSTYIIKQTKEKLAPFSNKSKKNRLAIQKIQEAQSQNLTSQDLEPRKRLLLEEADRLDSLINQTLITSQKSGLVYEKLIDELVI